MGGGSRRKRVSRSSYSIEPESWAVPRPAWMTSVGLATIGCCERRTPAGSRAVSVSGAVIS